MMIFLWKSDDFDTAGSSIGRLIKAGASGMFDLDIQVYPVLAIAFEGIDVKTYIGVNNFGVSNFRYPTTDRMRSNKNLTRIVSKYHL